MNILRDQQKVFTHIFSEETNAIFWEKRLFQNGKFSRILPPAVTTLLASDNSSCFLEALIAGIIFQEGTIFYLNQRNSSSHVQLNEKNCKSRIYLYEKHTDSNLLEAIFTFVWLGADIS